MVRNQLLCFVVPLDEAHAKALGGWFGHKPNRGRLKAMFAGTPTHFASFALLPLTASPPSKVAPTALLLELIVDPRCSAETVIDALLQHESGALLLSIYGPCLKGATQGNADLRKLLLDRKSRAQGGYIGCRDRTVAQIANEHRLFETVRGGVQQALRSEPITDSRALADVAIDIARRDFPFASRPSNRSFWRARERPAWLKAILIAAVLVVPALLIASIVLGAFAVPGIAALAAGSAVLDVRTVLGPLIFGRYDAYSAHAVAFVVVGLIVLEAVIGLIRINRLSITASLMIVIVLFVAAVAAPLIGPDHAHWSNLAAFVGSVGTLALWGCGVLLFLLTLGLVVAALFVVVLVVVPPYLGLGGLVAAFVLLSALTIGVTHRWVIRLISAPPDWLRDFGPVVALQRATPPFGLAPIDAVVLLLLFFAIIGLMTVRLWWRLIPRLAPLIGDLDRPELRDVPRAQQCDRRVAAGERDLTPRPNHMISLTDVRSPLCCLALRAFLRVIMFIGETWYTEGRLGSAAGIKFAHWHIVDGGRKLLFCSNFDGGFGGYLDEFINGVSQGINLVWRWTRLQARPAHMPAQPKALEARAFPPTWALAFGGCRHEQWFKAYARDSMVPHLYRYEAYLSTNLDIDRATRLRDSLSGKRSEVGDDVIMRAIES